MVTARPHAVWEVAIQTLWWIHIKTHLRDLRDLCNNKTVISLDKIVFYLYAVKDIIWLFCNRRSQNARCLSDENM